MADCREGECGEEGQPCGKSVGRWTGPGSRVVYLSEHPGLAVLEARVHLDMPSAELPDDQLLNRVTLLVSVEAATAIPPDEAAFGDAWLRQRRSAGLILPSVIVHEGRNMLLNLDHPAAREAHVVMSRPFCFDPRLWRTGSR